jgi:hypothetical protein
MVLATFGSSTAWEGRTISSVDGAFALEGHGPITAQDVMQYDRQGQLRWVNDGARAWVGSRAAYAGSGRSAWGRKSLPASLDPRRLTVPFVPRLLAPLHCLGRLAGRGKTATGTAERRTVRRVLYATIGILAAVNLALLLVLTTGVRLPL